MYANARSSIHIESCTCDEALPQLVCQKHRCVLQQYWNWPKVRVQFVQTLSYCNNSENSYSDALVIS